MSRPAPYASPIAIPLPPDDAIRRVAGASYDPATALNVIKMLAGTEDQFAATTGMVKAIFAAEGVDAKLREMIILRAAKILDVPYEWQANEKMARNLGLTDAEIDAAASDGPVTGVDPRYVLACRATDELSLSAKLSDATLQELLAQHGDTTTRKLVLTIAWFNLLSRFLNGCRVPLETTDKIGAKTSPID